MGADLETIVIYLQRRYNILREVYSLTEELAEAVERGDTVSASLLLEMRGEKLRHHAECEERIFLETEGSDPELRRLRRLAKGPLEQREELFQDGTEAEKKLEKQAWEIRIRTQKTLEELQRRDQAMNRRITRHR